MKILSEPPRIDFDVYVARPDTRWIERAQGDSLTLIYERGFLPYSGAKDLKNVFYSARSARIELAHFALSSENRRIAKRFDGAFQKERAPASRFEFDDAFYDFCLSYFAERHGADAMPRARLETIVKSGLLTSVVVYSDDSK